MKYKNIAVEFNLSWCYYLLMYV